MSKKIQYIYIFIFFFSVIFSYFLKIDISNGGASRDLYYHWNYIVALNENLKVLLEDNNNIKYAYPQHSPLHHIIISRFDYLVFKQENYLNFYFIFSLFLPIIFYYCLDSRFPEIEFQKKIFISSIIYFIPNFQASAIWGNSHITSLFFFLASLYFLINLEKKESEKVNLNIFLVVFFMGCAAYTRQYYVIFFPCLFINILRITKLKNIIFFCFCSLMSSIPSLFLIYKNPALYHGISGNFTDSKSSILIVLSIVFVYLVPFFISNFKYNFLNYIEILKDKKNLISLFILSIIFSYILLNFNYNGYLGGGFFYKISIVFIENNALFFLIAFLGLLLCFYYFKQRIEDIFLIVIVSSSFSSGYMIFQKYFEPMVIIFMFLLIKKDFVTKIFNFNKHIIFFYFFFYWLTYYVYSANLITKIHLLLPQIGTVVLSY